MGFKKWTKSEEQLRPDAKFNNRLAAKFINCMMWEGKKTVAQRIFYDAMAKIGEKVKDVPPIEVFERAVENVTRAAVHVAEDPRFADRVVVIDGAVQVGREPAPAPQRALEERLEAQRVQRRARHSWPRVERRTGRARDRVGFGPVSHLLIPGAASPFRISIAFHHVPPTYAVGSR